MSLLDAIFAQVVPGQVDTWYVRDPYESQFTSLLSQSQRPNLLEWLSYDLDSAIATSGQLSRWTRLQVILFNIREWPTELQIKEQILASKVGLSLPVRQIGLVSLISLVKGLSDTTQSMIVQQFKIPPTDSDSVGHYCTYLASLIRSCHLASGANMLIDALSVPAVVTFARVLGTDICLVVGHFDALQNLFEKLPPDVHRSILELMQPTLLRCTNQELLQILKGIRPGNIPYYFKTCIKNNFRRLSREYNKTDDDTKHYLRDTLQDLPTTYINYYLDHVYAQLARDAHLEFDTMLNEASKGLDLTKQRLIVEWQRLAKARRPWWHSLVELLGRPTLLLPRTHLAAAIEGDLKRARDTLC